MAGITPPGVTPGTRAALQAAAGKKKKQQGNGNPKLTPENRGPFGPSPVTGMAKHAGNTVVHAPGQTLYLNVRALQTQLTKDGYKLKVDGKLGPQTLSALEDYYRGSQNMSPALKQAMANAHALDNINGTRNPAAWNKKYGENRLKPMLAPQTANGKSSPNTTLDSSGVPQAAAVDAGNQMIDTSGLQNQANDIANTTPISEQLANFGTMLGKGTADAEAGQQYDAQIRDAQLALAKDPLLAKQHSADLNSWYDQVLGSQKTAAARDAAAGAAGVSSISDAGKALLASLGGGANLGAGNVAAASQNATGTQQALQTAEDQYNNDIAPILQNEKASMLTSQANADTNQQQQDQYALSTLQGQRGQAVVADQANVDQANNALAQAREQALLGIKQSNNSLVQQGFNNSLALAQAQIAAEMNGLQMQNTAAKTAATLQKTNNPFLSLSPTQKNSVFQYVMGRLYDPNTGAKLNLTPQQASTRVNQALSSYGFNPTAGTPSGQFGAQIVKTWATS